MVAWQLSLAEIDQELERLQVTKAQKQLIAEMGEALANVLDLPVPTMRGFYAKAVITWQQQINMTAAETETKMSTTAAARIKTAEEILAIMKTQVLPVVRRHNKEFLLNNAIDAALDLYSTKYANRPPDRE